MSSLKEQTRTDNLTIDDKLNFLMEQMRINNERWARLEGRSEKPHVQFEEAKIQPSARASSKSPAKKSPSKLSNDQSSRNRFKDELKDLIEDLPTNDEGEKCFPVRSDEHSQLDQIINKLDLLFEVAKLPRGAVANGACDFNKWKVCDCVGSEKCTHELDKKCCFSLKQIVDYTSKCLDIESSPTNVSRTFSGYFQDKLLKKFPGLKTYPRKGKSTGWCTFLVPLK